VQEKELIETEWDHRPGSLYSPNLNYTLVIPIMLGCNFRDVLDIGTEEPLRSIDLPSKKPKPAWCRAPLSFTRCLRRN